MYAEKTVQQIISGKAVSRALQAHLLAESVRISILFEAVNIAKVDEFVSILEKKSLEKSRLKILTYTRFPQGSYLLQGKMK